MSHGNLERAVVALDFWPMCENCSHNNECQTQPKHPAYPHTWEWSADRVIFLDGVLLLTSWIGNSIFGQTHTGCYDYVVHPAHTQAPDTRHVQYLHLEVEKCHCETVFRRLEKNHRWIAKDEALFATTLRQYKAVVADQIALRFTTVAPLSVAVDA